MHIYIYIYIFIYIYIHYHNYHIYNMQTIYIEDLTTQSKIAMRKNVLS